MDKKINQKQNVKEVLREMSISTPVNEVIKRARERMRMTTTDGSKALGITEEEYIAIENGEKLLSKEQVHLLAITYKMPKKIKNLGYDPDKSTVAQRITELRVKANKTQSTISKEIGVALTTYAGYESGRREPDIKALIKIATLYNVSIDYIVGRY